MRLAHGIVAGSLALALAAAGVCAQPTAAPQPSVTDSQAIATHALPSAGSPEAVGFDLTRLQRLDDYMARVVADGTVAGVTTLLARHGKVVQLKTYGKASLATGEPMRKDTIFRIYSMTKPVTGVAMMILFEEGKWRLDGPVTLHVPEFRNLKVVRSVGADGLVTLEDMKRPPTMRELISHTTGFGYGLSDTHPVDRQYREQRVLSSDSMQQMIDRTASIPLKFQPGTHWAYSSAVDIQGYLVEKLSGRTLGDFMATRILRPLGMTDTAFYAGAARAGRLASIYVLDEDQDGLVEARNLFSMDMPDYTAPPTMESGGGGLVSTTMDYARFAQVIANKGELDGVRILAPATVELMGTNMVPRNATAFDDGSTAQLFNDAVGFGLNLMIFMDARAAGTLVGDGTLSWGSAAGTWFCVDPEDDVIFVGMTQRLGLTGRDNLGVMARTLAYQALTRRER